MDHYNPEGNRPTTILGTSLYTIAPDNNENVAELQKVVSIAKVL